MGAPHPAPTSSQRGHRCLWLGSPRSRFWDKVSSANSLFGQSRNHQKKVGKWVRSLKETLKNTLFSDYPTQWAGICAQLSRTISPRGWAVCYPSSLYVHPASGGPCGWLKSSLRHTPPRQQAGTRMLTAGHGMSQSCKMWAKDPPASAPVAKQARFPLSVCRSAHNKEARKPVGSFPKAPL